MLWRWKKKNLKRWRGLDSVQIARLFSLKMNIVKNWIVLCVNLRSVLLALHQGSHRWFIQVDAITGKAASTMKMRTLWIPGEWGLIALFAKRKVQFVIFQLLGNNINKKSGAGMVMLFLHKNLHLIGKLCEMLFSMVTCRHEWFVAVITFFAD